MNALQMSFNFDALMPRVEAVSSEPVEYHPLTGEPIGSRSSEVNSELLDECLKFSVPIRMYELRDAPENRRRYKAHDAARLLSGQGDGLVMGDTKPDRPAATFEALVTLIALGALTYPDGATFRGNHWCRNGRCTACVQAGRHDRGLVGGGQLGCL